MPDQDDIALIQGALFQQGQLIRDRWWATYKAGIERLGSELRRNEQFAADLGHLVPHDLASQQPPPLPIDPDIAGTHHHAPTLPPRASWQPPPRQEEPWVKEESAVDEWRAEQSRRRDEALRRDGS